MVKKSLIAVFLLGVTWAQLDASQAEAMKHFELPPGLQGMERERVEAFVSKLVAAFKDKCEINSGPDAFDNAENALTKLHPCMAAHVNGTILIREVEIAKETGTIDEVLKKYCGKRPQYMACFNETAEGAKSCFSAEEQESLMIMLNVMDRFGEFVCFKDGDRIALFILEGGPECIMDKLELLRNCARNTFGEVTLFDVNTIPDITFTDKQCRQLAEMQPCVVNALATCSHTTAANIVESLFKSIRTAIPCKGSHKTHVPQETTTKKENAAHDVPTRSGIKIKHMDSLMQRKLELEIRAAELEIWDKENQLGVKHTGLTSGVQLK